MWHYKLKNIQFSLPKRYLEYRYYSETVKSSVINHTQNVATSFEIDKDGKNYRSYRTNTEIF